MLNLSDCDIVESPEVVSTQDALELTSAEMDTAPVIPENHQQPVAVNLEDVIADLTDFLKKRKFGYNKHITNKGRHELHLDWKNQNPPFVPAEYLPKEMRFGEFERVYEARRKQKLQELESHMELLVIQKEEGLAEFTSVDTHIEELIDEMDVADNVKNSLKEEYGKLICCHIILY